MEQTLVSALQILERALALERPLQAAANEAKSALLNEGLSKLILGMF